MYNTIKMHKFVNVLVWSAVENIWVCENFPMKTVPQSFDRFFLFLYIGTEKWILTKYINFFEKWTSWFTTGKYRNAG